MRKRFPAMILALALCIGLAVPAFAADGVSYGRHPGSSDDNHVFVTDGEFFYYIVDWAQGQPASIVKQASDGSKTFLYQVPSSDSSVKLEGLNLANGWLYFIYEGEAEWDPTYIFQRDITIYRVRTDGTGLAQLYQTHCVSAGTIHDMMVVDDTVYFTAQTTTKESPCLMSMNLDGTGVETLTQSRIWKISASGRQLLLLTHNSSIDKAITFYDVDTGEMRTMKIQGLGNGASNYLQASASGPFYLYWSGNTARLYQVSPEDGSTTEFDTVYSRYIIVGDQMLYYNKEDSGIYLRSLDDANTAVKITDRAVDKSFHYHNGWLCTRAPGDNRDVRFYAVPGVSSTPIPAEPAPAAKPTFTDLPDWCGEEAQWAADNGIAKGIGGGKFSPGTDCTHQQILTFLWRAEGEPAATAKAPVTVAADYAGAVNWAYEEGMIDHSFDPQAPCTRADAVMYIWQALGSRKAEAVSSFTDMSAGADCAGAVAWAVEHEVTNGFANGDGTFSFRPSQVCTRGQIACFLYRAYV